MNNQITLAQMFSKCMDCYYERNGICECWHSEYEDKPIPMEPCSYYDGVVGGIPPIEELKARYS